MGRGYLLNSDGIHLVGAGKFGTDKPVYARPDVTGDAGHARVRAVVVGRQFGFHDAVTGFAAKLHRLRKFEGVITAHGREKEEKHGAGKEGAHDAPVARARKVNLHGGREGGAFRAPVPRAQDTDQGQNHPANQESGRHHPGQDADVRVGKVRHRIQHEQHEEREQAADHHDQPGQTHPVSQQGRPVRRFPCDFGAHIGQAVIAGKPGDGQFAVVGAVLSTTLAIFTVPPAKTADTTPQSAVTDRHYSTKSKAPKTPPDSPAGRSIYFLNVRM